MATHPEGQGRQIPADRGGRASQELTSGPDSNGETKGRVRSKYPPTKPQEETSKLESDKLTHP